MTVQRILNDDLWNFDTPVRGLYIGGADTSVPGVLGALFSGLACAAKAEGYI
jgi:phytoene dehydrogenase-like protein